MRLIQPRFWALATLSALLQIAAFPLAGPLPYWRSTLAWFALTPLLLAVLSLYPAVLSAGQQKGSLKKGLPQAFLLGYGAGFMTFAGSCYWIYQTMYLYGGKPKPISFFILILFAVYLGLYQGIFAVLLLLLRKGSKSCIVPLAVSPALWVTIELARARITGFPWDLLGNSQVDNLLLTRLAPIAGVMSLSFVLAAVSASLAAAILLRGRRLPFFTAISAASLATVIILLGMLPHPAVPAIKIAVAVQENLAVGALGKEVSGLSPQEELTLFSALSQHPDRTLLPPAAPTQTGLIVWPEAPSHLQSNDPFFRAGIGALAANNKVPAIIGSLGVDSDPAAGRGYSLYDSASLFRPDGTYSGRYDKIHLVPWGEYIPFKSFFSFAQKLTEGAGDMDPGTQRTVFEAAGHRYGVFICYESIFGDEVRQFANRGAEVLVNISDDGWYGDTGAPWQHLNMARMRAIENHRWVIRSTNTGVTGSIDPLGRLTAQAPRHVRGGYALPFNFIGGTTFYTRHGDWFADLCALFTLLACALTFAFPQNQKVALSA